MFGCTFTAVIVAANLTYTADIKPIIEKRCSQCHNANWPEKNWMDYDTAFKNKGKIKAKVGMREMPPENTTGLTEVERSNIIKWIDQGAKK
jgi:uncharacterized membrane protein